MTRYLISFDAHAMDHIPDEDMPAVAKAAHDGGPGGHERRRVGFRRRTGTPEGERRGHRRERSPTARTRRPSAGSVSSTCPHARRRWSGLPRSPSPAAARKKFGSSCPTRHGRQLVCPRDPVAHRRPGRRAVGRRRVRGRTAQNGRRSSIPRSEDAEDRARNGAGIRRGGGLRGEVASRRTGPRHDEERIALVPRA